MSSGQDPQGGNCAFCDRPLAQRDPATTFQACASCSRFPGAVFLASASSPMRRPDPELLARALLDLREYVLSDGNPERPKYLTSSTSTKPKKEEPK